MTALNPMSYDSFASKILSLFPDQISDKTQSKLDDAVFACASEDPDIETYGETDQDEISRYQHRHADGINEQGPYDQIIYLLHNGYTDQDIIAIFGSEGDLTSHQKIELSAMFE